MPVEVTDILNSGASNPSGTKLILAIAPESDFESLQSPVGSAGTDNSDLVEIKSAHVFNTGKGFLKIEVETNKNEVNFEQQGAVLGGHHKQSFTGFASGLSAAMLGTLELFKRVRIIALVQLPDGQAFQLGSADRGARLMYNYQTGTDEGGERGASITIEYYGLPQLYSASISYKP